jgi:membrane protease YdiL (CAAX protease family)
MMKNNHRVGLFLFFLSCGLLVFVVFSHYFPIFEDKVDIIGRVVVGMAFLAAALAARRSERFKGYWLVLFAYFTALAAISIDRYASLSKWILPALDVEGSSPAGLAIEKLESSLLVIAVILALNHLAGQRPGALYIRRGNLRLGLTVGLVALAVMIATVIPVVGLFFKGVNLSWARILPWTPWVLICALSNASNEELLFRGLFIGKMEPFLGKLATNLATTIPFTLMHACVDYTPDTFVFLTLQVLPLSLAWCWLMQKTNSIWGSILFHAAMDIPVFVGLFSRM